ncbi:D-glycero-beta-D-manno-heptose 1-phosphate adenylyltransferase [Mariprofundus erugo]|uniref:D-glycero-beta-D-manno-heptose 1-phosphate adenylyltransferase n=1 Tax=Mariprofundus erugo TaxID=2528639 RepID=UPI0010FDCB43|nr:D-glycero-beta-D-manno-heptose 1-phosphate adenylyltransferase [Mariprofundus erugo]TLS74181.1 D-glycero-beta-D-manno-heptose 1-phosphate adenylyltransferase [Mariprofundus erugo]
MNAACDLAGARLIVDRWQADGRRIVFTNGCFDLLHPGHIDYLSRARALGDALIVGLNDDDSIRRLKGESRPVNPLADRAIMLAALRSVDLVVPFSEDTPLKLISALKPDILVKGGDYEPANIVGAEVVLAAGGKVVVMPFIEGYSTTRLIRRIYSLPR